MANEVNIGGIKIIFGADTKPLEDGGRRVEQTLDRAEMAANGLRMALGWMAGFAGFAALGQQVGQAVSRLENMQKLSRQVDQALKITGNTAETTSAELIRYAEALEASTGRAAEEIVELGANLASYGFTHDVFYRSIDLANDMSTAWGGDLRQNLEGLARALDDPIKGFAMLSKRGIKLTQDQKDLVQELINANDHLGAQGVVFEALEAQVSGVAEAGFAGLTRAMGVANEATETFFETFVQAIDLPGQLESGLETATAALGYLTDNMDAIIPVVTGVGTAIGVTLLPAVVASTSALVAMAAAFMLTPWGIVSAAVGALAGYFVMLHNEEMAAAQAAAVHERAIGENANAIEIAKTSSQGFRDRLREQIAAQLDAANAALSEARAQNIASRARREANVAAANGFRDMLRGAMGMEPVGNADAFPDWDHAPDPFQARVDAAEKAVEDLKAQVEELNTVMTTIPPAPVVYTGSGQVDDTDDRKAAKVAEQAEKRLEILRTSLLTEEEVENESYERKLAALTEFYEASSITEQQFKDMRERLQAQHEEKLTEITRQQQELRNRLQSESVSRVASTLDAISGALERSGEEQFGIVKALSVASALIKGYEAVTSSYAAGAAIGGPPVGIAFAALAAAQTAAQISQLMSVNSSSKGTPTMAGGGSSSPVVEAPAQGITVQGFNKNMLVSGDAINDLIDRINEAGRDGKRIHVVGTSE